jgi:hypothetical protein
MLLVCSSAGPASLRYTPKPLTCASTTASGNPDWGHPLLEEEIRATNQGWGPGRRHRLRSRRSSQVRRRPESTAWIHKAAQSTRTPSHNIWSPAKGWRSDLAGSLLDRPRKSARKPVAQVGRVAASRTIRMRPAGPDPSTLSTSITMAAPVRSGSKLRSASGDSSKTRVRTASSVLTWPRP